MKYFIDTEFIEGFHKPIFGKKRHFIDLISIGIVSGDGRKYFAISNEYKYNEADKWVQDNVIIPMYLEHTHGDQRNIWSAENFHMRLGKSNKQIAKEIIEFINPKIEDLIYTFTRHDAWAEIYYPREFEYIEKHNTKIPDTYWKSGVNGEGYKHNKALIYNQPEFYAYYADYDWVLFCSLFGRMIDLPKGFPMYCRDLKQMLDDCYMHQETKHPNETRLESWLRYAKSHPEYPVNKQEHNAVADAKFNKDLYDFIVQKKFLNKPEPFTVVSS